MLCRVGGENFIIYQHNTENFIVAKFAVVDAIAAAVAVKVW